MKKINTTKAIDIIDLLIYLHHSQVTERIGMGLQNLSRRFESALDVDLFN